MYNSYLDKRVNDVYEQFNKYVDKFMDEKLPFSFPSKFCQGMLKAIINCYNTKLIDKAEQYCYVLTEIFEIVDNGSYGVIDRPVA